MTGVEAIGVLIIRLWAASHVLTYLSGAGLWFLQAANGEAEQNLSDLLGEAAIWLTPVIIAFVLAPRIVKLMAPRGAPDAVKFDINAEDFISAGTFLIGLFFMLRLGPDLLAALINVVSQFVIRQDDAAPSVISYDGHRLLAAGITFAAALFLTFRPREIARLFSWLRQAGLPKVDQAD
jgi:hypothetical protein